MFTIELPAVKKKKIGHTFDEELALPRIGPQSIARIQAQFLTHSLNHAVHLGLKIGAIIDDVKIGMSHPRGRRTFVHFPSQFHILAPTHMVLGRIKLFSTFRRRYHVKNLVVPIIPQLHIIPTIARNHLLPFFAQNKRRRVHGSAIANNQAIPAARFTCRKRHKKGGNNWEDGV